MPTDVTITQMPDRNQGLELIRLNRNMFSDAIWNRGVIYYKSGKVELTFGDGKEIHANVYGTQKYSVRLDFNGARMRKAVCSCPYNSGCCKHEAAVLLAFAGSNLPLNRGDSGAAAAKGPVSKKQYAIKLKALAEREYHISRDHYYDEALKLFIDSKKDFGPIEWPERFSQIFTMVATLFPHERNEEMASKFLELSRRMNFSDDEAELVFRKMASARVGDRFLLMTLADPIYHNAVVKILTEPDKYGYYYRYNTFVSENLRAILDLMEPKEIARFAQPRLYFSHSDKVVDYLLEKKDTKTAFVFLNSENYYMEESERLAIAKRIAEYDVESAKMLLKKGFRDYSTTFLTLGAYWNLLTPEEKEDQLDELKHLAALHSWVRPFSILSGTSFTPATLKSLSLDELDTLKEQVKKLGEAGYPSIMKAIDKALSKSKFNSDLVFEKALGLIEYFAIPTYLGLLDVEILRQSFESEENRRLYLKTASALGQLDDLRLRRYPNAAL